MLSRFEEIVRTYPDKTAVAYKEKAYTFSELRDCSIGLADQIVSYIGSNSGPVACIVNRGAVTTVLFLSVLYSGNYYVPIDPDMPAEKAVKILRDSGAELILYEPAQMEFIQNIKTVFENQGYEYPGQVLEYTEAVEEEIRQGDRNPFESNLPDPQAIAPESPIYMVYTSGSTGMPKGVLKSHGAVKCFVEAFAKTFSLGADEVIGNQTPFFFDASAKDLYLMLYTGATMEVIPSELFIFPVTLVEYMNQRKITYACWVPTAYALVTQMGTFKQLIPETLKKAFFVGEVFPIKQLRKWMQTLPQIQYVNLYGSTEISGISCYYELDTSKEVENLPMGRPLSNCEVFLMDGDCAVSEKDVIGEVCIASDALALEYYHDPEKTAAVFVDMKTPSGEVKRVLRSGDLARYDENGNLLFVSRKDFQIKHMGRRIELGEIESIADTIEEIQRCCCLYDDKKKKIKLYCELIAGCDWDAKKVKSAIRPKISEYMLPNSVIILEKLPLNANGKIDRTALKNM